MRFSTPVVVFMAMVFSSAMAKAAGSSEPVSLAGEWKFQLDREDSGAGQKWFRRELSEQIKLPGSLQEQGFGDEPSKETQWTSGIGASLLNRPKYQPYMKPGNYETPFWLTPRRHYVGVAWYQREIEIPADWAGKRVLLTLQRPHWQTTVWVDEKEIGSRDSLGTPHEYDLTAAAGPGKHRLTIRVDNRVLIPVGLDAHSVTDQTQSNWNGIVGAITLEATSPVFLDDVQIYPDVKGHKVHVVAKVGNDTKAEGRGTLTVAAKGKDLEVPAKQVEVSWKEQGGQVALDYELPESTPKWDEFSPNVLKLEVSLASADGKQTDALSIAFGMRELGAKGTQFTINDRPIFLRGTLECCIFPRTGYPPVDVASWKKILTTARSFGLNHIRFHSWCPPEAAFEAADEMGFYYQVECSCWANFGDGSPVDEWVDRESQRMTRAYGNHPSFILMVPSNEPHGKNRDKFLNGLIAKWEKRDSRRKYLAGSGWPIVPNNQYEIEQFTRIHQSGELTRPPQTAADYREYVEQQKVPVLVHEMGQWCVYPNFDEIKKYTGSLKPGNLEIFRDFLRKAGMEDQAHAFLMASGKFQASLYKEEIEANLRTPGLGGFQLLDLHDFPGQGTAPVGVLDAFWEPKGYITAEQYRRFCSETVPLARLTQRVFTSDQTAHVEVDVRHAGAKDLVGAQAHWRLRDDAGNVVQEGTLPAKTITTGALTTLGSVDLPLANVKAPARLNFEVSVDGTQAINDWDLWVYPKAVDTAMPAGIHVSHELADAVKACEAGQTVLLLPQAYELAGNTYGSFAPIFWNRITFPGQRQHTLGVLVDPKNPALAAFPTDDHSNWQWWDIQEHCRPMVLDSLPRQVKPIVQMIDDWDQCRKLGLVFEAKVGSGKLVVCSADIEKDLDSRLAARQLRSSLLAYMSGSAFEPKVTLTAEQLHTLFREPPAVLKMGAHATADHEQEGYEARNVLDGNPETMWHTPWEPPMPGFPHSLTLQFDRPGPIEGLKVLPRQDGQRNGWIKGYEVYVSQDGKEWGKPVAKGEFSRDAEEKAITFARPVTAKFVKLVALSGFDKEPYASLAEVDVVPAK